MTSTRNVRCVDSIIRAFRQVPKEVSRLTYMKIKAGDYTDFPSSLDHKFVGDGCLVLEGLGDPVVVFAGPYVAGLTAGVGDNKSIIQTTPDGGGLTANAFAGYFARMLTGDNAGKMYAIQKNSTTVISLINQSGLTIDIANDDTFDIVRMPVRITVDHPISWIIEDGGLSDEVTALANRARVVMSGIEIKSTWNPQASAYLAPFRFQGRGTPGQFYLHNCKLQGYGVNHYVELNNACINKCAPMYPTTAALFEERKYSAYPQNFIAMNNGVNPTDLDSVWVAGIGVSGLNGFALFGAINASMSLGGSDIEIQRTIANAFNFTDCKWSLITCAAESMVAASANPINSLRSKGTINGAYVLTGLNACKCSSSYIVGDSFECSVTGVTAYGLLIGGASTFVNIGGCDAIGATDDIFRTEMAAANAGDWPAAGAILSDSLGSTVLTIK